MKRCRTFLLLLFAVLLSGSVHAQVTSFDFTIFKPLPEVDIAALYMSKDISSVQKVFQISIQPANVEVVLQGEISWTDIGKTSPQWIYNFTTLPFKSTTFYNTDLGGSSFIKIGPQNTNTEVIKDLIQRYGKPVGRFDFTLTLRDASGAEFTRTDYLEFINPTQSFTILTPTPYSEVQQGNIIISWIPVPGADHYEIKVNERKNSNQSLEAALASGNPIIDYDKVLSSSSSVMLSELPNKRSIIEGQELVVQVVAVIPLATGNKKLSSEIINFSVAGANDARDNSIKNDLMAMTQSLPGGSTFLNVLSDKNLRITRLVDENGMPISQDQLRNLLNYLNTNPDRVISAQFIYNNNQ
ncbi:MAG: hypothetical protein WCS69_09625 [Ignavibacteriaceae bacterium]|jgi:hypothetical protein